MQLRKLNEFGLEEFQNWLDLGAEGPAPLQLAKSASTSSLVSADIKIPQRPFRDRYDFGRELVAMLKPLDVARISNDRQLWTTLALVWFDQLCPPLSMGRKLDKTYRYILSADYRHYYRHLVRSPWQLVRDHGENARLLLLSPLDNPYPLRRHGEILEQLGGRQSVLRSQSLIAEANRLYASPLTGRPKKGVAGSGRGSVRRLALVLRQLDLTYDVERLPEGRLVSILPKEFDRWQAKAQ
jgi:hypothetical protein